MPRCRSVRRHHEAVAAVVAFAADDGDLAFGEIGIEGFDRGHDLAAGVFHQDQRGDADVLGGPAIGFLHLFGVEDSHRCQSEQLRWQQRIMAALLQNSLWSGYPSAPTLLMRILIV